MIHRLTSPEFKAMKSAQADFAANPMDLDAVNVLMSAERAYFKACSAAKKEWEALDLTPEQRLSCEQNAADTEGTDEDELWFIRASIQSVY